MSKIEHQQDDVASTPDEGAGAAPKPGYKVGYKRPPRHTQFKPGQSGNPKGRAKGLQNHRTTLNRVMNEKVSVREGDKTRSMTKFEAMLQAQAVKGMKADARSASVILNLMSKTRLLGDEQDANKMIEPNASAKQVSQSEAWFEHIDQDLLSKDEMIELSRLAETVDRGGITALSASDFEHLKQIINKGQGKDPAAA
jgi:hypothetical protein